MSFTDDAGNEESLTSSDATAEVTGYHGPATLTVGGSESSEGIGIPKAIRSFAGGYGGTHDATTISISGWKLQHSVTVQIVAYSQTTAYPWACLEKELSGRGSYFTLGTAIPSIWVIHQPDKETPPSHLQLEQMWIWSWSEADTVVHVALLEAETAGGLRQLAGHGGADHQRHSPGRGDADGGHLGHLGHRRHRRADQCFLQLRVDTERREFGYRHPGRHWVQLQLGR